jgi:hypothetical protein
MELESNLPLVEEILPAVFIYRKAGGPLMHFDSLKVFVPRELSGHRRDRQRKTGFLVSPPRFSYNGLCSYLPLGRLS